MEKQNPLDVLLQFLANKKLEISNLSLAKVTDDYLAYLEENKDQVEIIENISEFLWVASKLAFLKSKIILNLYSPDEEEFIEEDNSSDELRDRLVEYKEIKEVSFIIQDIFRQEQVLFTRKSRDLFEIENSFSIGFKKEDLGEVFEKIVSDFKREKRLFYRKKKIKETIKIKEIINKIRIFLKKIDNFKFSRLIIKKNNSLEITVSFLSVLEMAKQGEIEIKQEKCFREIEIFRNK